MTKTIFEKVMFVGRATRFAVGLSHRKPSAGAIGQLAYGAAGATLVAAHRFETISS